MSDSYCQMKWTILLSLFAFSNASTELNCPFWQPFADSDSFCESCSESFLRKITIGHQRNATADESNLANSLILLPYNSDSISSNNDCVCPLIFADKWCNPCAKPTRWHGMKQETGITWNFAFVDNGGMCGHPLVKCRGECQDVDLEDGKYYYIKSNGEGYHELNCPPGTYSDNTFDNRVKLRNTFISDFALNLDVSHVGHLYDSFRMISATSGQTFSSEDSLLSSFRDYHFFSRVCHSRLLRR